MYQWTSWWTLSLQMSCWAEDLDYWIDLVLEVTSVNPCPPHSPHWGMMTVEAAANLACRPPTCLPMCRVICALRKLKWQRIHLSCSVNSGVPSPDNSLVSLLNWVCMLLCTGRSTGRPYHLCLCRQSTSYHRAPDGL